MVFFNSPVAKIPPFSISASNIREFLILLFVNVSVEAYVKPICRDTPNSRRMNLVFKIMDN